MLKHVTFTGWDHHTDHDALAVFCTAWFPGQVEIAVLQSNSRVGEDRYPAREYAAAILRTAKSGRQDTAVHLCGALARGLIDDDWGVVHGRDDLLRYLQNWFVDRVQINLPAADVIRVGREALGERAAEIAAKLGKPVILQWREVGDWPPARPGVQYLLDRSGGRGEEMAGHPAPAPGAFVGYAGGLGPANVGELVAALADEDGGNPDANYWIDMESGIRESMSAWPGGPRPQPDKPAPTFVSIPKCMAVMHACAPFLR